MKKPGLRIVEIRERRGCRPLKELARCCAAMGRRLKPWMERKKE